MLPKELFKKIRRIEIKTNRLVTDVFAGQYHSTFKGRGMEFDEVREYQPGDDIRSIDWNVTARTGKAHIKKFIEERELTVMLIVDASASCGFGTRTQTKAQLAAEIAAVLAFSAIRNNDKVGAIFFTDKVEKFVPPRKGQKNVLRLIREILYFKPTGRGTDIGCALEHLDRVTNRMTISFLISDFLLEPSETGELPYVKPLAIASKRHDIVAIPLSDPGEHELKLSGMVSFEDAETGEIITIDMNSRSFRKGFSERALNRQNAMLRAFRAVGVDSIPVSTDVPYSKALQMFFMSRCQRRARH